VLNAESAKHLNLAIVHPHGNREAVFAQRMAQELSCPFVERQRLGDRIEL
jgi:hypothetical protein